MVLASANIGISGKMMLPLGSDWARKHRPKLLDQFVALLESKERPAGLLLNEVGNLNDLLQEQQRQVFNNLLREAFHTAGASNHGNPQIFWSDGETVAAFRRALEVRPLATLKFDASSRLDTWREVKRFQVIGPCSYALQPAPAGL